MSPTGWYEIRVAEPLEPHWLRWLAENEISLVDQPGPGAVLRARLPDQAALYGLLGRLRDLNLNLLEVRQVVGE